MPRYRIWNRGPESLTKIWITFSRFVLWKPALWKKTSPKKKKKKKYARSFIDRRFRTIFCFIAFVWRNAEIDELRHRISENVGEYLIDHGSTCPKLLVNFVAPLDRAVIDQLFIPRSTFKLLSTDTISLSFLSSPLPNRERRVSAWKYHRNSTRIWRNFWGASSFN